VRILLAIAVLVGVTSARADDSKLGKDQTPVQERTVLRGKNKLCCGYPLVDDLKWALRFYWLAREEDYQDPTTGPRSGRNAEVPTDTWVDLYTPEGYFLLRVPERYAWALRLEGSGLLMDGRVVNYRGACKYGYGTCFAQLNVKTHPFGRGAGGRPVVPFKSVAVDRSVIPIGTPLYITP